MTKVADEKVLVLDFGSQYAQLIARRVRQQQVYCEIVRHDIAAARIREIAPRGIILSGGPASVYDAGAPKCDPEIFRLEMPVLGICYGMQLACEALGGRVQSAPAREYGRAHCRVIESKNELFAGLPARFEVWMSHGDQISQVAADFIPLAATETCPFAAVKHATLPLYGLQFHPEVTHTPRGQDILGNFLKKVCRCRGTWELGDFARETIAAIRRRVGANRVICGLSGGVDSAVTAALISEAIGGQLSCILVDNGLLRKRRSSANSPITSRPTCTSSRRRKSSSTRSPEWSSRRKSANGSGTPSSNASARKRRRSRTRNSSRKARCTPT